MKLPVVILGLSLSSLSIAQSFVPYAGDYTLKSAVIGVCNSNAKVEAQGAVVKITNPDPRDNRGWSTVKLTPGLTRSAPTPYIQKVVKTAISGKTISVETTTLREGSEVGYVKDTFSFEDRNGRKSLAISPSTETRGNVSSYGAVCLYEKK